MTNKKEKVFCLVFVEVESLGVLVYTCPRNRNKAHCVTAFTIQIEKRLDVK